MPGDGHGATLATARHAELLASAAALGCARVEWLGYADSGLPADPADPEAFANADVEAAAERLAALLREEQVDVLTVYDRNGGYGHPDHVQVHRVGTRAAELAGTPVVLEATVPAGRVRALLRVLRLVGHPLGSSAPLGVDRVFSSPVGDHPPGPGRRAPARQARGDGRPRHPATGRRSGPGARPDRPAAVAVVRAGLRPGVVRRAGLGPARHASTTCSHRYGARRRTRTTLCSCTPPTMEI